LFDELFFTEGEDIEFDHGKTLFQNGLETDPVPVPPPTADDGAKGNGRGLENEFRLGGDLGAGGEFTVAARAVEDVSLLGSSLRSISPADM
jgi:hypothetical protein